MNPETEDDTDTVKIIPPAPVEDELSRKALLENDIREFETLYNEFSRMIETKVPRQCTLNLSMMLAQSKDEVSREAIRRQIRYDRYIDLRVKLAPYFFTSIVIYLEKQTKS